MRYGEKMSYSSIYVIDKEYNGLEYLNYENSWLFTPIILRILPKKYIPKEIETPYGYDKSIIGIGGDQIWRSTNDKINKCDNLADRICWELQNQQIFFTKDNEIIANGIMKFVEQNKEYCKDKEDKISPLEREHIIARFSEIANGIKSIDENEYPYFVLKNSSCDDGVEFWFSEYDEETDENKQKSIKDCDKFIAEFVQINKDGTIEFVSNLDFKY